MLHFNRVTNSFGAKRAGGGKPSRHFSHASHVTQVLQCQILNLNLVIAGVLFFFLFLPTASAQQSSCAALPKTTAVPMGNTSQSKNRAALAAALNSPDAAAKKLAFEQQMAKLAADPNAQSQRAAVQKLLAAAVNSPDLQNKRLQMQNQLAVAQNSATFLKNKAAFQTSLKCTEH